MKKIFFTAAIILGCLSIKVADAQIHFSVGVNLGSQPEWGPVGYDHADYYYMPDIDAYYDVPNHQYVYYDNNAWVRGRVLPPRYHFDRYHSYKVVVNQRNPWERDGDMRQRYAGYRGRGGQAIIRDSRDAHYQNHWRGDAGQGDQGRGHGDQGRGQGDQGRGHGDQGHGNQGHGDHGHGDHGDH
ncbi:MAG: hypothetical protein JWR12_246 [Mucilaginibacter sp.]|nr:hypothetical protein [Mucilaginibacter sp.]